jgi:sec-independent protein translocase protein TatC
MDYALLKWELINQFKSKLGKIVGLLLLGIFIGWYLAYYLILKVKAKMLPQGVEIIALTPLEFVIVQLKLSLIFAFIFILPPMIFWITRRVKFKIERRTVIVWGTLLGVFFVGGVVFAYSILLPFIIKFLTTTVVKAGIEPLYSLDGFMFFTVSMMLIMGLVFEFPIITTWLTKAGVISPKTLTDKRRYAYVMIFVVAAVITPDPSPVSQTLVAVPFLFFYELSVMSAKLFGKLQKNT